MSDFDYHKRKDREAFRKRYPSPYTGMIGNKRMHEALAALDAKDDRIEQLVGILRRLIDANHLREQQGEDTIGVLMKCGAFHEFGTPSGPPFTVVFRGSHGDPADPLVDLARAIDAADVNPKKRRS